MVAFSANGACWPPHWLAAAPAHRLGSSPAVGALLVRLCASTHRRGSLPNPPRRVLPKLHHACSPEALPLCVLALLTTSHAHRLPPCAHSWPRLTLDRSHRCTLALLATSHARRLPPCAHSWPGLTLDRRHRRTRLRCLTRACARRPSPLYALVCGPPPPHSLLAAAGPTLAGRRVRSLD